MRKHTFSTRPAAGADAVEVTVSLPSYDEATDKQRRNGYDDGVFGQGCTVPVQTLMRPRMQKGMKLQDLTAFVQAAFLSRLNGTRVTEQPIVDAKAANLTAEQVVFFEKQGYLVVNK